MKKRPLWRCPKCGRQFVTRNIWHSCARWKLAHHFKGKNPKLRALFRALVAAVRENGPVKVVPNKTYIALQVRMRFAGVTVQNSALRVGLLLRRRVRDNRFFRVESPAPRCHGHVFRLAEAKQIDRTLRRYLAEAYRVGRQEERLRA